MAANRLKTSQRKDLVLQYVRLTGDASPIGIVRYIKSESGNSVSRKTIIDDVKELREKKNRWLSDNQKLSFVLKAQQMFEETNIEIKRLQSMQEILAKETGDIPEDIHDIMSSLDSDDKKRIHSYLQSLVKKLSIQKAIGKVAYSQSVIIECRNWLSTFNTNIDLITQYQEYINNQDALKKAENIACT